MWQMVDGRIGAGIYLEHLRQGADYIRHLRYRIIDFFASVPSTLCQIVKYMVSEQS